MKKIPFLLLFPITVFPILLVLLMVNGAAVASEPDGTALLSQYREGDGPVRNAGTMHLLDDKPSPRQLNTAAYDLEAEGARESITLRCTLHVDEDTLASRQRDWRPPPARFHRGYLADFAATTSQADKGCFSRVISAERPG